ERAARGRVVEVVASGCVLRVPGRLRTTGLRAVAKVVERAHSVQAGHVRDALKLTLRPDGVTHIDRHSGGGDDERQRQRRHDRDRAALFLAQPFDQPNSTVESALTVEGINPPKYAV